MIQQQQTKDDAVNCLTKLASLPH